MKKLIIFTIIIVGICFAVVEWKLKSGSSDSTKAQQQTQSTDTATDEQSEQSPEETSDSEKLAVSDEELLKLKSQNLVSSDEAYYIKSTTPFPKIVDLHTGSEYRFEPSASYTKVSHISWSGDGSTLAYIYQVSDASYTGADLLNTATIRNVVNQSFPNASRVLAAGAKLDYDWLDGKRILYYTLQNYDLARKFYANGSINIYNIQQESFEYPLSTDVALKDLYSISLSAKNRKFLYVEAVLDEAGTNTVGQQYVVMGLDGTIASTDSSYDPNWAK